MKAIQKPYMNSYLAGFLLGLVLLSAFFVTGRGLGASGSVKSVVVSTVAAAAPEYAESNPFYAEAFSEGPGPMKNWLVYLTLGVLAGAFFSGSMSGRLGFKIEKGPRISSGWRLLFATFGGLLFGLGAQFGRGCTSGAALTGMAILSTAGFVTMMAIFGSGYVVAYFLGNFGLVRKEHIMGPLIPLGFVNPELNLFFAFVIGLGFGYVLEQAGFSSSRKLAGVFYGYDFVVLRVFFTAAITAMSGILLFNYIGWLDVKLLYVNPFFLWSAIIGGVIMGVGFILGGFCPGTSLVAAVIGRIDAIFFVIGSMIGIFFFGQFYSLFESIYTGNFLGNVYVYDSLGMGREWFAFMLIAVALMAFVVTQIIEDKVNDTTEAAKKQRPSYLFPTSIILFIGILLLVLPQEPRSKWHEKGPKEMLHQMATGKHLVPIDKVAYSLIKPDAHDLVLIDVRSLEDYNHFSLPGAINIPKQEVILPRYSDYIKSADRIVLYSHADTDASEAWMLLYRAGHTNIFVMEGGLNHFFAEIFDAPPTTENHDQMQIFQTRFREEAQQYFREGKAAVKPDQTPVPVIKQVEIEMPAGGGC